MHCDSRDSCVLGWTSNGPTVFLGGWIMCNCPSGEAFLLSVCTVLAVKHYFGRWSYNAIPWHNLNPCENWFCLCLNFTKWFHLPFISSADFVIWLHPGCQAPKAGLVISLPSGSGRVCHGLPRVRSAYGLKNHRKSLTTCLCHITMDPEKSDEDDEAVHVRYPRASWARSTSATWLDLGGFRKCTAQSDSTP